MEVNYFTDLPSEITTEILSRLSIRSLAISKSVCKAWRDLFDFVKSKIKTPPALVRFCQNKNQNRNSRFEIFKIEDEDDLESHDLHYIPPTDFDIPHENSEPLAATAANGLLLLHSKLGRPQIPLFICNPITRQYMELWAPEEYILDDDDDDDDDVYDVYDVLSYEFGMSKISGQYKVLCIDVDAISDSYHHVYTLGTGTWRRVEAGATSRLGIYSGAYIVCNGILHWIGGEYDLALTLWVCGFDLENECFGIFSPPPLPPLPPLDDGRCYLTGELSALMDSLCYSYTLEDDIVIWLMKEYHVEESWTILYKISSNGFYLDWAFVPDWKYMRIKSIKLFKDGDILMLLDGKWLIYYSNRTRTIQQVGMLNDATATYYVSAMIFTPSLFSLKNFVFENVISF